jgi:hypothetical protein
MEPILQYKNNALKEIQTANYLLSTAYKLLKQPKTLLLVTNHVFNSYLEMISALLSFERAQKIIPPYHDNDESKLNAFREHLVKKYNLSDHLTTVERILYLSQEQKKAPIEFSRDGKYIICSDQFEKIEKISEEDVKNYIRKAKDFITVVEKLIPVTE